MNRNEIVELLASILADIPAGTSPAEIAEEIVNRLEEIGADFDADRAER